MVSTTHHPAGLDQQQLLASVFQDSLSAQPQVRLSAESQLTALVSQSDSSFPALFWLVVSSSAQLPVRQAAAIYLKNHISLSYLRSRPCNSPNRSGGPVIQEAHRSFLRQNLLAGMSSVPAPIRSLLVPSLKVVISEDYPDRWPDLLDQIVGQLSAGQPRSIESGLIGLLQLIRLYRWTSTASSARLGPEPSKAQLITRIVGLTFPAILRMAQNLLTHQPHLIIPPPSSTPGSVPDPDPQADVGNLLYLIMKIYKTSITSELSIFHQQTIVDWTQLLIRVSSHQLVSSPGFPSSVEDRERWSWTRAKKWSYFILKQLHSRYGSPAQLSQTMIQYKDFGVKFIECFSGPICRLFLEQLERYLEGTDWMSRKMICHVIGYLESSIRPKETWTILKQHVPTLLSKLIFPSICITLEDLEEFEFQPEQFIKSQLNGIFDNFYSTQSTMSSSFIITLASGRKKSMFYYLLSFITEICSKYPVEGDPRNKEGALVAFSCMASLLVETGSIHSKVEDFFKTFVFPEFDSQHAFLRAKTCEVIRNFNSVGFEWSNPELLNITFQGVLRCFTDKSLPVRVQAALTLSDICDHPQIHDSLTPNIPEVMQGYLRICNEIDLDNLTHSVRKLISKFSNELLPYSEDLALALNQSFIRLMSEITDLRERLGDSNDEEEEESIDEKVFVAMSILQTLQQLVVGLEGKAEVLNKVQQSSLPLIVYTLKEGIIEIYDVALELLDSIQFASKAITTEQWSLFETIYDFYKTAGPDLISEIFPVLDNFISYGSEVLSDRSDYFEKLLDIYVTSICNPQLGSSDRVISCKLADSILLCLGPRVDRSIPIFLEHTMKIVQRGITNVEPVITKALLMHSLEVVLNSIYHNPRLTIRLLVENGWSSGFFGEWFSRLDCFKRTHDKKLAVLAICSILGAGLEEGGGDCLSVQSSGGQLLIGALKLFENLPQSIRRRYELEMEYSNNDSDGSVDEEDFRVGKSDDEDGYGDENGYKGKVRRENHRGLDEEIESSLWSDEILWETPLDKVDVYKEFYQVMKRLSLASFFLRPRGCTGFSCAVGMVRKLMRIMVNLIHLKICES
ncbi:armadillo-type protein [Phakopsora pachyrhizi]|nr:armadillo-type protein [Phakopsora pachyrhizi]